MNGQPSSDNGASRLDRIEKLLEMLVGDHVKLVDEHRFLLRAQVVLTEKVDKLADAQQRLTEKVDKLADAQQHTEERLNALISVVDDLVRRPPPPPPRG